MNKEIIINDNQGRIMFKFYLNDRNQLDGIHLEYSSGILQSKHHYRNGVLDGEYMQYSTVHNCLTLLITYRNGIRLGRNVSYHLNVKNNQIKSKIFHDIYFSGITNMEDGESINYKDDNSLE